MSRTEAKSIHSTLSWAIITIDKIIDICNDAVDHRDLPTEFGEAYRALPFIRAALQKAGSEVEPELGNGPESLQDAMDHAKRCQQNSLRLEAMFRRVALKAGVPRLKHPPISRMDQYRMALDTYGDDYEVISLLKMILEDAQELGKNFLKEAEADLQILVHIQQKLQALTPSIPKGRRNSQVALSNWGSGTSNANMSSGSQYNNADHGKQFNATTQIFGKDPEYTTDTAPREETVTDGILLQALLMPEARTLWMSFGKRQKVCIHLYYPSDHGLFAQAAVIRSFDCQQGA